MGQIWFSHITRINKSLHLKGAWRCFTVLQCAMCCCALLCVAVCCYRCSVLLCVAACCSVLQCNEPRGCMALLSIKYRWYASSCMPAVCCSAFRCVAVCCSVLQCVAVCCSVLQCVAVCCSVLCQSSIVDMPPPAAYCSVLQCVAVCCSALQCVAICCSELRCVAACCSVLKRFVSIKHRCLLL